MRIHSLRHFSWALAVVGALSLFGASSCNHDTTAPVTTELTLRNDMRRLWTEHVLWTRVVIIASVAGLPDADAATQRLLQNQVDLGNAIKPFYGEEAGNQLTALLHDHITGALAVVVAAKAGDTAALATANAAWYANAHQISVFLANANPNLPLADVDAMMREHLDQTEAEAAARLHADWTTDIQTYDMIVTHIQHMSDAISGAIATQFPDRVGVDVGTTASAADFDVTMRSLWEDHTSWTRVYLIDAIAGLPDADAAAARLQRNQDDIGAAVSGYYGVDAGTQLAALLHEHISLAARVVVDAKTGNTVDLNVASSLWYANGDQIADFLAGANPNWSRDDLRAMMRTHLDTTLTEATARLHGDWTGDVAAYDTVEGHILHMSDTLSSGIVAQFPDRFAN